MILRTYFFVLFCLTITASAHAQPPSLSYQQEDFSGWLLHSNKPLKITFPLSAASTKEAISVDVVIGKQKLRFSSPVQGTKKGAKLGSVLFSMPLLDAAIDGHLDWGKSVLEALDSQQTDSIVLLDTYLVLPEAATNVAGSLALSFKGGWNTKDEFWNRAAQYKLLAQQIWVNDSVLHYNKEVHRTQALISLNKKSLAELQADQQQAKNKLRAYCKDSSLVDSLLLVENNINDVLDIVHKGKTLANAEKMKLADRTTQRSQLLQQIDQQKNEKCQQLLNKLLQQIRFQNNILRQRKILLKILQIKDTKLQNHKKLQHTTTQQLAIINARLSN